MTELSSVKIRQDLLDGLFLKFPDKSLNEIFTELSTDKNWKSRKTYRPEDVGYAVSQIEGFRKEYPNISIEEIFKIIKEVEEYKKIHSIK